MPSYTVAESYAPSIAKNNRVAALARSAGYSGWADIVDGATEVMTDAADNATLADDLRFIARSGAVTIDQTVTRKFTTARNRVIAAMRLDEA